MYRRKHGKCDEKRKINIIHLRPRFFNNVQVWRPLNCIVRSFALFLLFLLFDVVMAVKPLKGWKNPLVISLFCVLLPKQQSLQTTRRQEHSIFEVAT